MFEGANWTLKADKTQSARMDHRRGLYAYPSLPSNSTRIRLIDRSAQEKTNKKVGFWCYAALHPKKPSEAHMLALRKRNMVSVTAREQIGIVKRKRSDHPQIGMANCHPFLCGMKGFF